MAYILSLIQGALVGVANIIPGVSGGTFALVLGIYERLLSSIGAFGGRTVKVILQAAARPTQAQYRRALVEEIRRTDALWLAVLAAGAALAILASSRLIGHLLDEHLAPTLAFFIGLIIPSILVPLRLMERRAWPELLGCLVGVALLVGLTLAGPGTTGAGLGLLGLFLAGVVAVSAMILPGVSGSFMLMILGEYRTVIEAINHFDWPKLGVFALGCLVGIAAFARLLSFLLKRFHSITLAFLIGLIVGSGWVLWPFKEIPPGAKIVTGTNVWPQAFSAELGWAIAALLLGLLSSSGVMWLGKAHADSKS